MQKKTLIIIGHPELKNSIINKKWIEEVEKYPADFTVHNLHKAYPDYTIDVEKEQKLIEQHENIILQYPLYWFNCPALLKKWIDEVFTYGWAFGSKGDKMKGKKLALAISTGIKEEDYQKEGKLGITINELILPFMITANYTNSIFKGFYTLYGSSSLQPNVLENSVIEYISFIRNL